MTALQKSACAILLALLLILSLRMTMSETLLEPLSQIAAHLADQSSPKPANIRATGPAYTAGFAAATTLLAALAALLAALTRSLSPARLGKFLLITLILTLALCSAFHAANRFTALIGVTDLATALLAAWAISLLCHGQLLGDRGRQFIIAALLALLAAWIAKGFYQYFIDFPDTIAFYHEHKIEQLLQNGINPNDAYQVQLFESRLNAREVSGFFNLSNVAAAAFIGLLTLLTALITTTFAPTLSQSKIENRKSKISNELPLPLIFAIAAALLLLAGLLIALLTKSRGGAILSILCSLLAIPLIRFHQQFLKHRKKILTALAALIILTTAVLISYGLTHNALPSKSLTFRWHYWTAAVHLIHQHPALGVGLNNFGEFYTSVKRPSSPEDVTDPHSFFIRLAAELGLPATLLLTLLLLWTLKGAMLNGGPSPLSMSSPKAENFTPTEVPPQKIPLSPPHLVTLSLLSLLFWMLHYFLAEPPAEYFLILSILYAILTTLAAAMFLHLLAPAALRTLTLAALLGALGMLAYDQINMALVTGPVAMLFWTLLALTDSHETVPQRTAAPIGHWSLAIGHLIAPLAIGIATIALACYVWLPLLTNTMPLNPLPAETRFIQAANESPPNNPAALTALNQALALDPRNLELLNTRIAIKLRLHLPVAADIRHLLTLDTANAPIRIQLASLDSDLPPAERIQILNQALNFNRDLPDDEPKRLPQEEITRIKNLITTLTPPTTHP